MKLFTTFIFCCFITNTIQAQTIGTFSSVTPSAQSQVLVIPTTHTFQRLIKSGDGLSLGGTLGNDLDFTGYISNGGSSTSGKLSISSESTPAQVAILDLSFSTINSLWSVTAGGKVTFNPTDIGDVARFCSGTVTPNNTIIVSEENLASGNSNSGVDSYEDRGWLIEIDPVTRTVINQAGDNPNADKLWALGRDERENAVIKSDNTILYTGTDNSTNGFLYKFIPTVPGDFSSGALYVLRTTASFGTGTWKLLNNTTVAERHSIRTQANAAPAAYNFNGIEDVEIGPDGKVYFTAKGLGRIYRFTDNGATVSNLEVFAGNDVAGVSYDVDGAGPLGTESWGIGNDNLAFDGEGNLWILQDGSRNHIWVISPTHTQALPQVRLFGKTPSGSEPTGISFTPDNRYMFISLQHPSGSNSSPTTDAAGISVIFNTHTTLVIARKEFLGPQSVLPIIFNSIDAKQSANGATVNWHITNINNHSYFEVERSVNGTDFISVHKKTDILADNTAYTFSFEDSNLPEGNIFYYRIKQCDINGSCRFSETKTVRISNKNQIAQIFPQPAKENLNVQYYSSARGYATILLTDANGKTVFQEKRSLIKGTQTLTVNIKNLSNGMYTLSIIDNTDEKTSQMFVKN